MSGPYRSDPTLTHDLESALASEPYSASLHNALGLVLSRTHPNGDAIVAEVAAEHYRQAITSQPGHLVARLNLADALSTAGQKDAAIEEIKQALAVLEKGVGPSEITGSDPFFPLDDGPFAADFGWFRVEWEKAAMANAGDPVAEARAKHQLLRWQFRVLLGRLTGDLVHAYEAYLARPDLIPSPAILGCTLAQKDHPLEALAPLRQALESNPFDRDAARALFHVLGLLGDHEGQRRFVEERRELSKAAPQIVPAEAWFSDPPPRANDLVSIIILCCNQLEYTKLCLESLLRCTRPPYELVLVDNGSTDGTAEYLAEIRQRTTPSPLTPLPRSGGEGNTPPVRVVVIRNETNQGFPAGCNQGLSRARGRYVCFLNNDTVLTPGWLETLVRWSLHDWPGIGLVGPVTNQAPDAQGVRPDYANLDGLDRFAERRRKDFGGQKLEVRRLTGFCLLVRREVLDRIGTFDERWGAGFFDDDDLCLRARDAGFRLVIAQEVYIHHFGSRTFHGLGLNTHEILRKNFDLFKEKWGAEHVAGYRLNEPPPQPAAENVLAEPRTQRSGVSGHPPEEQPLTPLEDSLRARLSQSSASTAAESAIESGLMENLSQQDSVIAAGVQGESLNPEPAATVVAPSGNLPAVAVGSGLNETQGDDNAQRDAVFAAGLEEPIVTNGPQPKVSLCMIVKNEEERLGACLESAADLFDEIIIVDTGSADRTKEVAARFGTRVFDFPWIDNFGAARNECLRHATGRWIIWLDGDDRLDAENRERLRRVLDRLGDEMAAYSMKVRSVLDPGNSTYRLLDQVRIFPHHPQVRWDYRIHEQTLPAVLRLGGHVRWTDVVVDHVGYQQVGARRSKLERNLRLLEMDKADRPDDPFTLFNLGWTLLDLGRTEEGLPCLQRALERSSPDSSIVRKLYHLVALGHKQMGQKQEARDICRKGLERFPDDSELLLEEAMMMLEAKETSPAEANLLRLVEAKPGQYFGSVDDGMRGYRTRDFLARHFQEQGRFSEAEIQWRSAVAERPNFLPAWLGLGELYLRQRRWPDLERIAGKAEKEANGATEAAMLRARAEFARKQFGSARRILEGIMPRLPQALGPRVLLSHVLLQDGNDESAAEQVLRDILTLDPNNGEAQHNLSVLMRKQGKLVAV
jgi:GT2 family glycosyltransferase/tetratricopeptide (TPR) repeat protein